MSISAFNACIDQWKRRGVRLGELPESILIPAPAVDRAAHHSFIAFIQAAKKAGKK